MTTDDLPRSAYPRPQRRRDEWRSLNGEWAFEFDHGQSGRARGLPTADDLERTITVPFPPESELSGVGHRDLVDQVWYRRSIDVPAGWLDGRLLLHVGAVDYEAEVWANGGSVATHRGGYAPFSVDLTDHVDPGENTITVCALDEVRSGDQPAGKQSTEYESDGVMYTRVTGIWQPVWLEPVPKTYLDDLRLTPDLENGRLHLEASIRGSGADELAVEASFDGSVVGETTTSVAGSRAQCSIDLAAIHPWTPEEPNLYDLDVELRSEDGTVDEVESYAGLRSVEVADGVVHLNGEPRFQRLVLDQGYYPDGHYTAPTDEALRRDVELGKELGFDGARLHQKVFEPRFLYHADRLGYLVWGEFGDWGLDRTDPANVNQFLQEWLEVLERDYSHPSIVGWTPFNETLADRHPDIQRTVYRATKAADPTRPVIDASGYHHVETDILDAHDYTQDVETFRGRYQRLLEDEPIEYEGRRIEETYGADLSYVSEYGGIWWNAENEEGWGYGDRPESEDAFIERYRGLTEALLENPEIGLFCYTQLYDVEQECNGLLTYDREHKFDPGVIREINEQRAAIEEEE